MSPAIALRALRFISGSLPAEFSAGAFASAHSGVPTRCFFGPFGVNVPVLGTSGILPVSSHCSISAFGPDGPYAQRPAYDPIVITPDKSFRILGLVRGVIRTVGR
jgi:hypothetical protein